MSCGITHRTDSRFRKSTLSILLLLGMAMSLIQTTPMASHHSFAMFDQTAQRTLSGTVSRFEWTNPHVYIEIDVPADGGASEHWSIELGSPSILMRSGWTFNALSEGDEVTVRISPLRSGDPGGLLEYVTLPDGSTLGNGPGRGPQPNEVPE